MFGISPFGWLHTLGSLPVPRSAAGLGYFVSMLIGAVTVFLVAHEAISYIIGTVTILLLLAGYGVGRISVLGRAARYLETIFLSLTAFLLMLPTVTEILRRVPDGHPLVTDLTRGRDSM